MACQTTAIDLEIHFHSSPRQQQGHFTVSSLLPTVCLQSAEWISLITVGFLHCCVPSASAGSVQLFGSVDQSYLMIGLKFLGQAGPRQVAVSRLDAELTRTTPGMDWVSGCPGPFWQLLVIARLSIWLSIISSGNQDCFSSTVSAFQSLCRDRFWQQVLWSGVRTLVLLGAPRSP